MKKTILIYSMGFLTSTALFIILLSQTTIPEYIISYEVECKKGPYI